MPWATSNRRATLPKDWHKQRARAWRAAGGQCEATQDDGTRCTWRGRLNGDGGQADHINGPTDPALQWLCRPHHTAKTQTEATAAMHTLRSRGRHPTEQHPGLT